MSTITFKELVALADKINMDSELLESFSFACRVKNLTNATLKCYAERLTYLVRYASEIGKSLAQLSQREIQSYLMSIMDKVSAATVNGRIRVFKVFYRYLKSEDLIEQNPMEHIKLVRAEQKIKPVLSPDEIGRVLSTLDRKQFHGSRNFCMILLTYDSMLRLNELLTIKLNDVDLNSKLLKVYGKGRKERYAPFSDRTATILHAYIVRFRKHITGDLLFPMLNGMQITQRRAERIFTNTGRRAGVYLYPHLVRHSSASQFIRLGGNPSVLQKILGHSSLLVTQRYVHLSNNDMNQAYEKFSPVSALTL